MLLPNQQKIILDALEASSDGVLISDNKGYVLYVNRAYELVTGLQKEQMVGYNLEQLMNERLFNISASLLVLKNKKPVSLIHNYITGRNALTTASPIYDDRGEIIGVMNNTRNVWELLRLRNELAGNQAPPKVEYDKVPQFNELVFKSEAMVQVVKFALRVAVYDSTIMIQGESGTGKEVIAKFIHQNSGRQGSFVKVNCAAIPNELFESELFGYNAGSFTGASLKGKPGLFEMAHKGTILLDEISELPLPIQSKLLRVIQEKEILRVGASTSKKLDIRILVATNKDLRKEVDAGNFREDLFFRLNVVPITIPPLRERKEDIAELIDFFLGKLNLKYNKNVFMLPDTVKILKQYAWPGNVRELENLIEYLFVTNKNDRISPDQLPIQILANYGYEKFSSGTQGNGSKLDHMLELFEKKAIITTLKNNTSLRKASKILGIHPSTLSRKIKKYDINTSFLERENCL